MAVKDSMLFDNSLRGSKHKTDNQDFDYKKKLLEERKINKDFLNRLKLLTIEEVLYLKIDSLSSSLRGKLLGFPILKYMPDICKEAFAIYALSTTKNKTAASTMLGINIHSLNNLIKKYNIDVKEIRNVK